MATIHVWTRNEDESFEHLTFLNLTVAQAVKNAGDREIIAVFNEDVVVEGELTYELPSRAFNKTIWWYRPREKEVSPAMDLDEFIAHLDTLGEE